MSLGVPWALLGLLAIPLLIFLERLRRRPRAQTWPSLVLWRGLDQEASARRRRIEPLLVYECLAVALLSLAAAEPSLPGAVEASAVVVVDVGPIMQARRADGETAGEATERELESIPGDVRRVEVAGDLIAAVTALDARLPRVLATARIDVEGPGYLVVGRAPEGVNIGIDAVEVRDDELWFALACDGDDREVEVRLGGETHRVQTGRGVTVPFAEEIEVVTEDNYDGDDRCRLRRYSLSARDETGSRFVAAALFEAGAPATRGGDDLIVRAVPGEEVVRGAECVAAPGIFEGLFLDECVWRGAAEVEGPPLLTWRGRTLAAWADERTLLLGLPVARDWDEHGTLAVLIERAKLTRISATLTAGEARVGDAIATPAPRFVVTRGVDRPYAAGALPEAPRTVRGTAALRTLLAVAAVLVLAAYLRAIVSRS